MGPGNNSSSASEFSDDVLDALDPTDGDDRDEDRDEDTSDDGGDDQRGSDAQD